MSWSILLLYWIYHHFPDEYSTFRRVYEAPILKSRAPDASEKDTEIGEARTAQVKITIIPNPSIAEIITQLLTVAKSFVLRRDATLLGDYLPPKRS